MADLTWVETLKIDARGRKSPKIAQNRPKSPKTPKIDARAGGVRSAGWVKKADLTGAKTPKINARGYQYRKIKSGRPKSTSAVLSFFYPRQRSLLTTASCAATTSTAATTCTIRPHLPRVLTWRRIQGTPLSHGHNGRGITCVG
jgi:hypothetical protein